MNKFWKLIVLPLALISFALITFSGCSDDDEIITVEMGTLSYSFTGLENLGADFAYEGWIIVDGTPMSTGTFTVDDNGMASADNSMELEASAIADAATFILTIEPVPDDDAAPASTHYLAGDFVDASAAIMVGHAAALGDDFMMASGTYILNTPSTLDTSDWNAGIWWLDPALGPMATLILPVLPAGWIYEGWVVGTDGPVTTGTFSLVSGDDSDMGGPTAGPDGTPPFPGQDYINPLMPLIGLTAVISVEPMPDNSTAPFTLKPLMDTDIMNLGIGVLQSMENMSANFPTGTITR